MILYSRQNPECKNITVTVDINQNTPFFSDDFRVKVILQNLISNAFQYCDKNKPENEVKITVGTDKEKACFEVWDNGIGIPKNYQSKVFDMFFRANSHTKGTGLGLYIVKDALEKLNGEITMVSKEKEYTCFQVSIPNLISTQ